MASRVPQSFDPDPEDLAAFSQALACLDETLDWVALGKAHCHEDGEDFFDEEQREAIQDAGLHFAGDLGERLGPKGRSLYVGAGVAELVPMLFEALVLHRDVRALCLPGDIADLLNKGLQAARAETGRKLPVLATSPWKSEDHRPIDHLWMVSVLTDPEAFPALHDRLYKRRGSELATRKSSMSKDRPKATALIERAVKTLQTPAWLSTTDEELELIGPVLRDRGIKLDAPDLARLSAIVGDSVRLCRLTRAGALRKKRI